MVDGSSLLYVYVDRVVDRLFLFGLSVAKYVLYSTIIMVNFKIKRCIVKSNPYKTVKSGITTHKSGYYGIALCIYFTAF